MAWQSPTVGARKCDTYSEMKAMPEHDRARGALLGLACGDAVGTTVEFSPRGSFVPLTDMVGGGPFKLRPGEWTDDTSMALCLAESIIETGGLDLADQLRRYVSWWRTGYLSATGSVSTSA
jgi:ADP-ribosyl-[dinitrogen reductase] hydrolase